MSLNKINTNQIKDFIDDIISTDSGNLLEIGTDDKLMTSSDITAQGNTFNGASQLVQLNSSTQYPALDGSLITGVSVEIDKTVMQIGTCTTAAATAAKEVTISDVASYIDGATYLVNMTNANTSATITFNVNSLGAKNIYDKRGTQITGTLFNNNSNEDILIRYNSTMNGFELLVADFWSARMGMPSGSYIDLTLGATGSTYTAPANGYVVLSKDANAAGQTNRLVSSTYIASTSYCPNSSGTPHVFIPVKKDDVVTYSYSTAGATNYFKFVYAEGSKP
jgi:hypothetical protein